AYYSLSPIYDLGAPPYFLFRVAVHHAPLFALAIFHLLKKGLKQNILASFWVFASGDSVLLKCFNKSLYADFRTAPYHDANDLFATARWGSNSPLSPGTRAERKRLTLIRDVAPS